MEWIGVVVVIGVLFILKVIGDSKFVKRQNEKAIKDADQWVKKNKKYVTRMKKIEDKYINEPADKYIVTPIGFIIKAMLIITGISILVYVVSIAGSGLVSLYYGSPLIFLFLMWLIFFRPRN